MIPFDHVWYLPHDIDVITCPKNGMSSVKRYYYQVWKLYFDEDVAKEQIEFVSHRGGPQNYREQQVWNQCNILNYPFRKRSFKIAIKRDPIARFISAVEYLENRAKIRRRSERDYVPRGDIESVLHKLEKGEIYDVHLMPQSHFMGTRNHYDAIFDMTELTDMFRYITKKIPEARWGPNLNPHYNKMKKTDKKRITDNLSPHDILRIKILYKQDYENGWC